MLRRARRTPSWQDYRGGFWWDVALLLFNFGMASYSWGSSVGSWIYLGLGVLFTAFAVVNYHLWQLRKPKAESRPWDGKPPPDPSAWVYDAVQGVWNPPAIAVPEALVYDDKQGAWVTPVSLEKEKDA